MSARLRLRYKRLVEHALLGVESRVVPDHVYTTSRATDHEVYSWFRGRWPSIPIVDHSHEHYLVDPPWWDAYFHHFDNDILDVRGDCILQLDIRRPLVDGNLRIVKRGVWLAIEIARNRENL